MLCFLAAPDENPGDVQGIGTDPGNLVISWTVSYITVRFEITYCSVLKVVIFF